LSYTTNTVPVKWKIARSTPIYKKGDKSDMKNYRPISVTSVASKIMEHIIVAQLNQHLSQHALLSKTNSVSDVEAAPNLPLHSLIPIVLSPLRRTNILIWLLLIFQAPLIGSVMHDSHPRCLLWVLP